MFRRRSPRPLHKRKLSTTTLSDLTDVQVAEINDVINTNYSIIPVNEREDAASFNDYQLRFIMAYQPWQFNGIDFLQLSDKLICNIFQFNTMKFPFTTLYSA